MRSQTQEFFSYLQDKICRAIEEADGGARFSEDDWRREGGGGGRTRVMGGGGGFEKAGVNFSAVEGVLPEEVARKIEVGGGRDFFATGGSLVLHPRNPYFPTVHADFPHLAKGAARW